MPLQLTGQLFKLLPRRVCCLGLGCLQKKKKKKKKEEEEEEEEDEDEDEE